MGRDRTLPNIPTGGSVATTAYSFGIQMGAKTVILVGQDLAMTGNKTHADGTFQDKMQEIDTDSGEYLKLMQLMGEKYYQELILNCIWTGLRNISRSGQQLQQ